MTSSFQKNDNDTLERNSVIFWMITVKKAVGVLYFVTILCYNREKGKA